MTFGEAFAAARAAGLPDFEYNGKRFTTDLAGETKKEVKPSQTRTLTPAPAYSLGDVEFRAEIDPIISRIPPALLKYQDIEKETGGDVGELIKVILGEDDPNNPGFFRDFTKEDLDRGGAYRLGRYNPTEDERYYREEARGEPGMAYAFEPNVPEESFLDMLKRIIFRREKPRLDTDRLIETLAEELAHGGMRILEDLGLDPIDEKKYNVSKSSELPLEEEIIDQYQYMARTGGTELSPDIIGGRSSLAPNEKNARILGEMLNRIDEQALEELKNRRGYAQGGIASIRKAS